MANTSAVLSSNKDIAKAIKEERIFYAPVTRFVPESADGAPAYVKMTVPLAVNGAASMPGVMYAEEADAESDSPRLYRLVGMRIPFVISGVDDEANVLVCSRKIAQEKLKISMLSSFTSGEMFDGTIVGFTQFGAFVDVNGVVGLLRNADYSTDHSRISERYKEGDHISVKCKTIGSDERKRITWEAVTKYHRTTPFICDVEAGAMVLGRIVDIRNLNQGQAVFVRLQDNNELDVLCSMPAELEIEKGLPVVLRITSVRPGADEFAPPRLRGKIMRASFD